jgi:hypothetical protein
MAIAPFGGKPSHGDQVSLRWLMVDDATLQASYSHTRQELSFQEMTTN